MHRTAKVFLSFLFGSLLVALCGIAAFAAASPAMTLNLPEAAVAADDDVEPDVKARVARISFIRGEAKIRRAGNEDWESVTLNLPVVEGDDIVTESGSRVEIQFDKNQHLRLDENAYLRIVNLKDEGIAVSLSLGTMTFRVISFDKDRSYFEIDAPKTTMAVQNSGTYRVDAGKEGDSEVRVAATDGGEARVYSDNAGFTLKNGRSVRVFIAGDRSGEWETAQATRYSDEFDEWASNRDGAIAKRLKEAHYDKYYDNDIYGADDLNDYGEWVHTRSYGYVWRPHRTSISRYADWSPYRYGHWRWMQPYGWIWVNDEPWGWATYHHGRWVYDAGYWNWSPYGYYRHTRSWWFPALVVINVFNNNVCWYPLPYHYGYYNYNSYHINNYYYGGNNNNTTTTNIYPPIVTGGVKPIPPVIGPTGGVKPIPPAQGPTGGVKPIPSKIRNITNALASDVVPTTGVVTLPTGSFGTSIKGIKKAPISVATSVLAIKTSDIQPVSLPSTVAVKGRITRDIATDRPKINTATMQSKVGAAPRNTGEPLDNDLRTKRVFGGRPPAVVNNPTGGTEPVNTAPSGPRKTGAIDRQPPIRQSDPPVRQAPVYSPPRIKDDRQDPPVRQPPRNDPPPVKQPRNDPPQYDQPPVRQPPPRNDPPPVKQPPRSDPPPVKQPPRSDPPPVKQPRNDPPPVKSDPKPEPKIPRKADGAG